ncbi:ribosome small subunit-dependent GTPase A [bacterium]|nr:ribosome small subunit-dependent GTPase A [bacterium]
MNNIEKYCVNERFINEAKLYPQYCLARVVSQYKNMYKIVTDEGECFAEVSGKYRHEVTELREYPAVGDFVMINPIAKGGKAVIQALLTRKSAFERTAVGVSDQIQVIAANVDIVFICMSLNNDYNLSRLERYLAIAWDSRAKPVVVLTKADLCQNLDYVLTEIKRVAIATDIIVTSAFDKDTLNILNAYLTSGVTAAFIGSSGVGKSTLINKLLGKDILPTGDIGNEDKGRHTTTGREMLLLPQGAIVIDNPGMRELGVESVNLAVSFADIEELIAQCKYSDCTHTNESGCAIKEALVSGVLDERRLENYMKIKREAKYDGLSSRARETEKLNQMFSEIGGIKKVKQFKNMKKRGY